MFLLGVLLGIFAAAVALGALVSVACHVLAQIFLPGGPRKHLTKAEQDRLSPERWRR
jgi:hypothetical protein